MYIAWETETLLVWRTESRWSVNWHTTYHMENRTNNYSQSPGASRGTGHLHVVDVVCHLCEKVCKGGRGLQVHLRTCMKRSSPAVATVSTSSVIDRRTAMAPADVSCTQPPVADKRKRNSSGESATSVEEPGVRSPRFPAKRARTVRGKRKSNPTGESPVVHSPSEPLNDSSIAGCPYNAGALDCRETATVRMSCRFASSGVPDQPETLDVAYADASRRNGSPPGCRPPGVSSPPNDGRVCGAAVSGDTGGEGSPPRWSTTGKGPSSLGLQRSLRWKRS